MAVFDVTVFDYFFLSRVRIHVKETGRGSAWPRSEWACPGDAGLCRAAVKDDQGTFTVFPGILLLGL